MKGRSLMEYITLGRTGLEASVMGLGGGGHSRLGSAVGKTEDESISIVRQAIDAGINFIDTAEAYGTEPIVGRALKGLDRDKIILSTKKMFWDGIEPAEVERGSTPLSSKNTIMPFQRFVRFSSDCATRARSASSA
jgi:aryl-alcohol dehydrogenase-like predicted oxidoreductase